MQINFEKESVRKYFADYNLMKKKVGAERSRLVKKRIDQLTAATYFGKFLITGLGKPHQLYGNLKGYYSITITSNIRLIIQPDSENLEAKSLDECDIVIIKGVLDYHGTKNEWIIS